MLEREVAESLALVSLIRGLRRYEGVQAVLKTPHGARPFAEVAHSEPVRHEYRRVIAEGRVYVSAYGVTPLERVTDLVRLLVRGDL
ncbi:hypothetical protein [Actinomadura hibisca]|uniref:hypothetical protein n=1 Tax=Actinomadura hibisca TaxID=68565 RepID=UPI00082A0344|nr:hypothetical protein [Actinomadura hibisca]